MTDAQPLEAVYRRYIDALNERRIDDLGEFCHDEMTYNGEPLTRADYQRERRRDVELISDLHYGIDLLVVGPDHVACRLAFDCHPSGRFTDVDTDGRRVAFAEHVFYRFRDGRIQDVWSLIDIEAVRRQLA